MQIEFKPLVLTMMNLSLSLSLSIYVMMEMLERRILMSRIVAKIDS
jgi:hypothetical protein